MGHGCRDLMPPANNAAALRIARKNDWWCYLEGELNTFLSCEASHAGSRPDPGSSPCLTCVTAGTLRAGKPGKLTFGDLNSCATIQGGHPRKWRLICHADRLRSVAALIVASILWPRFAKDGGLPGVNGLRSGAVLAREPISSPGGASPTLLSYANDPASTSAFLASGSLLVSRSGCESWKRKSFWTRGLERRVPFVFVLPHIEHFYH